MKLEVAGSKRMFGHIGFSYVGFVFLLLLFVPNLIWTKKNAAGLYRSA